MAKNYSLSFYAGDVFEAWFILDSVDREAVSEVCWTCRDLGLCVHLPYSQLRHAYCLRLDSSFTQELPSGVYYFDLTVELIDGNRITLIYDAVLTVYKKINKLCKEDDSGE